MRFTARAYALAAASVLAFAHLSAPAIAQTQPPIVEQVVPPLPPEGLRFDPALVPDREQVLAVLNHSAAAQMAQLKAHPTRVGSGRWGGINPNWISATYLIGLARLAREDDSIGAREYLRNVAEHYNFGLLGAWSPRNMLDADNIAIGDVYQELYARSGATGEIAPLRQRLDYNLPYLQMEPEPDKLVWWWCDALFMAPPVFARMAQQMHDHSYLQAMDTQYWRLYDRLWSEEHSLFFRDERFVTRTTRNDRPVFWGRGNGWVVAGLARTLEVMPANFASRDRYITVFRTMMDSIARLQREEDGLWTTSLLDPEDPPGPETTGSAFYIYAMAWGINHGILDRATYESRVLRGWAGLANLVQPNGLLGFAQRAGDQPEPSRASDHALYGTGGLLLAGIEVMHLGEAVRSLPEPELTRDPPPEVIRLPIAARPRPANGSAEELAHWTRAQAERQAMIDLGFDPLVDGVALSDAPPPPPRADGIVPPRLTQRLTPPPAAEQGPRASVAHAPYRFDDLLWENDRVAHRIYGPALEMEEPPSGSGIDAWGKDVPYPFMERQLQSGKQHDYLGEGIDFYNVGQSRGAGALGIWQDNKLWTSRNWSAYRILTNGPDVADFEVDYAAWPVGVGRSVSETRRFTLPVGTNFTRITSTLTSDKPGELLVGIGIQKRPTTTPGAGTYTADRQAGRFSMWTPEDPDRGAMGVALMVDPGMIVDVRQDADNYLVIVRVQPGQPFVYYLGSAWSKGHQVHDAAGWTQMVMAEPADISAAR
ncbi:glycoside hydrolase family 88 protein [Croceibacterium mercuriale]|uniref:glycoside hydrolase family 88 protein n=1 Tax=Croceibacterium mercuriale TaxID=1572751 RepID=UPI0009DF15ED|nr:glycoside hydrolase family 88 protein [Croceibacterium mercuriale]